MAPMDPAAYQDWIEQQRKWLEMTAAASGTDMMALQAMMFQNPMMIQQQQYMWEQMAQQQVWYCVLMFSVKCDCFTEA